MLWLTGLAQKAAIFQEDAEHSAGMHIEHMNTALSGSHAELGTDKRVVVAA